MKPAAEPTLSWQAVAWVSAAWLGLLALHYALLLAFAGWVGTADGFIPWSLAALALWHWTRGRLGFRPLTAPGWPRMVLALYVLLLALALAGIDEGGILPAYGVRASIAYGVLPIGVVAFIVALVLISAVRHRRSAAPAG